MKKFFLFLLFSVLVMASVAQIPGKRDIYFAPDSTRPFVKHVSAGDLVFLIQTGKLYQLHIEVGGADNMAYVFADSTRYTELGGGVGSAKADTGAWKTTSDTAYGDHAILGGGLYGYSGEYGYGIRGKSLYSYGVWGETEAGTAVLGSCTTGGSAFVGTASNGTAGIFQNTTASVTDISPILRFIRATNGVAVPGIGAGVNFQIEDGSNALCDAGTFGVKLTDTTYQHESSSFTWTTRSNGVTAETMELDSIGILKPKKGVIPGTTDTTGVGKTANVGMIKYYNGHFYGLISGAPPTWKQLDN